MAAQARPGAGRAAMDTVNRHRIQMRPFGIGMTLPPADQMAFYGGLGVLALFGLIEWPVAAALVVGHALSHSHHSRALREFGEALEQA